MHTSLLLSPLHCLLPDQFSLYQVVWKVGPKLCWLVEQFESPDSILIVNQRVKVPAKGRKLKDSEGDILVKRKYVHLVHAL